MSPSYSSSPLAPLLYAGIDVAKATLALDYAGHTLTVPNSAAGHAALIQRFDQTGPTQVVVEATGGYEQSLVAALHAHQILVSVIQPRRIRAFAEGQGWLAKTDALDAAVLRQFGEQVHPAPMPVVTPAQQELAAWVQRRRDLVEMQTMEQNRLEHYAGTAAAQAVAQHLKSLKLLIGAAEAEIARLIAQDPVQRARAARLQELKGVGPIIAATLLAEMPELGTLSDTAAAALAGVAPYNQDSGPHKGRRTIRGGRLAVRCGLYLAAWTASRYDPIFQATYQRLLKNGKAKLVALVAVMRKLIVLANHLLKHADFKLQHGSNVRLTPAPSTPH